MQAKIKLRGREDDIKFAFANDNFISNLLTEPKKSSKSLIAQHFANKAS